MIQNEIEDKLRRNNVHTEGQKKTIESTICTEIYKRLWNSNSCLYWQKVA